VVFRSGTVRRLSVVTHAIVRHRLGNGNNLTIVFDLAQPLSNLVQPVPAARKVL
jgi:hypothetical protein